MSVSGYTLFGAPVYLIVAALCLWLAYKMLFCVPGGHVAVIHRSPDDSLHVLREGMHLINPLTSKVRQIDWHTRIECLDGKTRTKVQDGAYIDMRKIVFRLPEQVLRGGADNTASCMICVRWCLADARVPVRAYQNLYEVLAQGVCAAVLRHGGVDEENILDDLRRTLGGECGVNFTGLEVRVMAHEEALRKRMVALDTKRVNRMHEDQERQDAHAEQCRALEVQILQTKLAVAAAVETLSSPPPPPPSVEPRRRRAAGAAGSGGATETAVAGTVTR